jgi:anti-sigma-K factor RskA
MTRDHTTIEELMAAHALGGLDDDDLAELERERTAHGDCEECRALEIGFAEVAGRLPFALDPEPVDEAMADRILAEPVPRAPEGEARQHPERGGRWRTLVTVAAALAITLVVTATLVRPGPTGITAASPTQRIVTFQGEADGHVAMAYTPGQPGAVLWGTELPDPGDDSVYAVWMIQDGDAVSGGCVRPENGSVALAVDQDLGATDTMAVTVEPASCPSAPTSTPILTADLSTVV